MKKFTKALAAIMLMVAVGFTVGCTKEPNNNGSNAPEGAIGGVFSVSAMDKVYFSQGNLQYQASTNTWRFAEKQYYTIGESNCNISYSYSGWIDLFGWGTSGYNNKYPYMISTNESVYGDGTNHIAGTNYDWGVYNSISNGGSQAGLWRTLTRSEWEFLLATRYTSSGIRFAKAQVNGVNGAIIVPDNWKSTTYRLKNTNVSDDASYTSNVISESVWQNTFEPAGAVFLPAAGSRGGASVHDVGSRGCYWSSSYGGSGSSYASYVNIYYIDLSAGNILRYCGLSVRLVCPAN